jgi:hypothetical protein
MDLKRSTDPAAAPSRPHRRPAALSPEAGGEQIFVSYARSDFDRIRPSLEFLREKGIRLWYDQEGIMPSEDCFERIAQAILGSSALLVFLGESAASSRYVRKEISYALSKEKPILPVYLEEFAMPAALELQIGTHQGLDFYRLEADEFHRRLLASLSRYASERRLRPVRRTERRGAKLAGTEITVAPENQPPFKIGARVFEEDTYLVPSAYPEFKEPDEHVLRILTELSEQQPQPPGSVVAQEDKPLRLLAIVHDLSQGPSWREEWIAAALEAVFHEIDERGIRSVGLPVLGRVHGSFPETKFVELLRRVMMSRSRGDLERIWLIADYSLQNLLTGDAE